MHELAGSVTVVPGAVAVTVTVTVVPAVVVGVFQGVATAREMRETRESVAETRANMVGQVSNLSKGSERLTECCCTIPGL